jgi:hypothetical protein
VKAAAWGGTVVKAPNVVLETGGLTQPLGSSTVNVVTTTSTIPGDGRGATFQNDHEGEYHAQRTARVTKHRFRGTTAHGCN